MLSGLIQDPVGQAVGAGPNQADGQGIAGGMIAAPGLDPVQGAVDGQGELSSIGGPPAGRGADLGFQGAAHRLAVGGRINPKGPVGRCLDKNVPQPGVFLDFQGDPAVESAIGQGLGLAAERRNVQRFPAVAPDRQDVFLAQPDRAGQVDREGGITAGVMSHPLAVAVDGGIVGRGAEGQ